jgi:ABC-type nitrate/sulfonate/bicarbonate transport system permease component
MAHHKRKRVRIYRSVWHLAVTFFVLILPIVFLFIFANVSHSDTGALFGEFALSLWRLVVAYSIAVLVGWVCAVTFYRGRISSVALPAFDVLQSFPTFAALPLATYLWGRTSSTVIIFLVLTIVWPIFFSILSSLRLVKRDWEDSVSMLGLKGFSYFRLYLLPITIPGIITGSIIGLGEGWEALVATEIIVTIPNGLGAFFQRFSQNTVLTVLGIAGLLLLIFSVNKLLWIPLLDWSHERMEE